MDSCRKSVPIPYELVAPLILAQDSRILTWQCIWSDHIAPVVLGDTQKIAYYRTFIDFVRISSTLPWQPEATIEDHQPCYPLSTPEHPSR